MMVISNGNQIKQYQSVMPDNQLSNRVKILIRLHREHVEKSFVSHKIDF